MRPYLIIIALLFAVFSQAQTSLIINEVCSRNTTIIADEDNDFEDWLEIYNGDTISKNLNHYYISDDKDEPMMWQFPNIILDPEEYLLVFASGKDRKTLINHWETALFGDSLWRYKTPAEDNSTQYDYVYWSEANYNDSDWLIGYGAFGDSVYGYEETESYTDTLYRTIYLRNEFYISDTSKILAAVLHAYYDDGFTVYINGYEIMRENMIQDGIKPYFTSSAFRQHLSKIDTEQPPETFIIEPKLFKGLLKNGRNVLAIENHNLWNQHPKLIKPWLSFAISDTIYQFDTIHPLLSTHELPLHSNFKINGDGEKIYLSDSLGQIIQELEVPPLPTNISIGFHPDFSDSLVYYSVPSPQEENGIVAQADIITDSVNLLFSSGKYIDSVRIEVLQADTNFVIRYTTDGSLPRDTAHIYDTIFYMDSTCVLRFRYFSDSLIAGPISDFTFFINDSSTLDVFSIITDPYNLWDNVYGIYTLGSSHSGAYFYFGANFWQNWERPVHIQQFNTHKELLWQQDAGLKIHGNYSRAWPQKSLGFYAKSEYGQSRFEQSLFSRKPYVKDVKRFLLRNAGNDYHYAHLRDLLIQTRMQNENIDIQSGKPVLAYLNGEYWGIYHLREKIDRFYLEDNWGVNPDSVNLLEQNGLLVSGERNSFESLLQFVQGNDLSISANYQYVSEEIDIENWINNLISNLYHHNTDWPHHNTKFWNAPGYKWRQILVDQDVTMSYSMPNNQAHHNSLTRIQEDTISYLAIFYKELLKNEGFKIQYTNRFADLMNTIFLAEEYIPLLDSLVEVLTPEMERHTLKWEKEYSIWETIYVPRIRNFINDKSSYMRNHLRDYYNLGVNDTITLAVSSSGEGKIKLNSIYIDENNWTGLYFDSIPVRLEAIPNPGYEFIGWESPTSPQLADSGRLVNQWYLKSHDTIMANFYSPSGGPDTLQITFAEINYRSFKNAEAGDWVEIYNNETDTIDLSNWKIKGSKPFEFWKILEGIKLPPQSHLVLTQDTLKFSNIHPDVQNYCGSFSFGLSSDEEQLSIWDELDRLVSYMSYTSDAPWPDNSETSQSIELANIESDYHLAENWQLSCPGGSPGIAPRDCSLNIDLVFSEINYKSHDTYNSGDWVELLNNTADTLDISYWIFRDGNPDNQFILPKETQLLPNEMIILAQDTMEYFQIHERNSQIFGSLNFGLSASGEQISLSNQFDQEVIQLEYSSEEPWPEDASGNGFTIELSDISLPMHEGENWIANCFLGTPLHNPSWCIQPNSIIISEVKYQSAPDEESGDWIELYNSNQREVDLKDWKLIHSGDTINIDSSYMLQANSYVVMLADSAQFFQVYESDIPIIPAPYFDLQKEEDAVFVLNPYRHPGNILFYHYLLDWPVFQTDTNNRTLELKEYSNTLLAENWRAGCDYGTPGLDPSFCDTDGFLSHNSPNYFLLVHPNPTSADLSVEFQLTSPESLEIFMMDTQSNIMYQEKSSYFSAGKHIIKLDLQRLQSGIYFLQIRGDKGVDHQKIIKIK